MATRAQIAIAAVLVSLVGVGCAGRNPHAIDDPLKLKRISLAMAAGANGNRPARVELVRVADKRLVAELVGTDTRAWFATAGDAFRRAHPTASFEAWEVVPGHAEGPVDVKLRGKVAGVLFCDAGPDSTPFRVVADGHLTVAIDDTGCRLGEHPRRKSLSRIWRRPKAVEVSFALDATANGQRPLRVELVRVDDADLVTDLKRMTGASWFGGGGMAFRRAHPDASVDDWELVPGHRHGPYRLAVNGKANGLLFCGRTRHPPLEVSWRRRLEVEIDGQGCALAARTTRSRLGKPLPGGERR